MNVYVNGTKFNTSGDLRVKMEGDAATYGIAVTGNTPAATPTDVFTLYGSASKVIKIKRILVAGAATTAGSMTVFVTKRTAANTGGTSTAPTIGKYDSADATPAATPALYTANPSALGAGVALRYNRLNFGVAGSNGIVEFNFSNNNDKPIILNSATEGIAINLNGGTVPTGGAFGLSIEWEEVSAS